MTDSYERGLMAKREATEDRRFASITKMEFEVFNRSMKMKVGGKDCNPLQTQDAEKK